MNAVTLTDPPEVVRLKTRFRQLSEREERLKAVPCLESTQELEQLRQEKALIANQVFNHERAAA